jgi:hypothetical protein
VQVGLALIIRRVHCRVVNLENESEPTMKAVIFTGVAALAIASTPAAALDLQAARALAGTPSAIVLIKNTGCGPGKTFDFKTSQCRTVTASAGKPWSQQRKEEAATAKPAPKKP